MRPLSDSVTKVTGKTFSRKYVALGRVISHWTDIVGKDFASKAQPVKIQYRYKKKTAQKSNAKKEKPQATLEIATSSADATIMHYQKDVILERINQIFGDAWITAIRFVLRMTLYNPVREILSRRLNCAMCVRVQKQM